MAKIVRLNGPVERAILHCAAVPGDWHKSHTPQTAVQAVRGWHKARGWADVGYHYLIMPDGGVARGRALERDGAHVYGHNRSTLGILLVEKTRIDQIGQFDDFFTPVQRQVLLGILAGHEISHVSGHNEFDPKKLCPGFKVVSSDWV